MIKKLLLGSLFFLSCAQVANAAIGCLPGDCCNGHPCEDPPIQCEDLRHPAMRFPAEFYKIEQVSPGAQVFSVVVNCEKVCAQCPGDCDCDPGSGGRGCSK